MSIVSSLKYRIIIKPIQYLQKVEIKSIIFPNSENLRLGFIITSLSWTLLGVFYEKLDEIIAETGDDRKRINSKDLEKERRRHTTRKKQ